MFNTEVIKPKNTREILCHDFGKCQNVTYCCKVSCYLEYMSTLGYSNITSIFKGRRITTLTSLKHRQHYNVTLRKKCTNTTKTTFLWTTYYGHQIFQFSSYCLRFLSFFEYVIPIIFSFVKTC